MKVLIAVAILVAGISAIPPQLNQDDHLRSTTRDVRIITDAVASAIEQLSQDIRDDGLDPLYIDHDEGTVGLPVPVIFNIEGILERFLFHGLSNIIITDLNYSLLSNRLQLGLNLPFLDFTIGKADCVTTIFGEQFAASASGRFVIKDINVHADLNIGIQIIGGIHIQSVTILFNLGSIDSRLVVNVANYDLTKSVNTFLGTTVPKTLDTFEAEVNELIEIIALPIINDNLSFILN